MPLPCAARGIGSVIEVFGCTEAGSIGYRYHSAEPFELLPYYDRTEEEDLIRRLPEDRLRHTEVPDSVKWLNARAFHWVEHKDRVTSQGAASVHHLELLIKDQEELLYAQSAVSAS